MNKDEGAVVAALATFAVVILFGTAAFSWLEGWDLLDSLYFTVYTVTTVGYGDLAPSPENRLFTSVFILVCATLAIACIAVIGNWIVSVIQKRGARRRAGESSDRARRAMRILGGEGDDSELEKAERTLAERMRRI